MDTSGEISRNVKPSVGAELMDRSNSIVLCAIWLRQPVNHPPFIRVTQYAPDVYGHEFLLRHERDLTAELRGYLSQAYAIGEQRA